MLSKLLIPLIILFMSQLTARANFITKIDKKSFEEIKQKSKKDFDVSFNSKDYHIRDFKKSKRLTGTVAKYLLQLSINEKELLLDWVQENQASINKSHIDIIKMLLGNQKSLQNVIDKLRKGQKDKKFYWALSWLDWVSIPALHNERSLLLPLLKNDSVHVTPVLAKFEKDFWWEYVTQLYLDPSFTSKTKLLYLLKDIEDLESLKFIGQVMKDCTLEKQFNAYYYYISLYLKSPKEPCRILAFKLLCQLAEKKITLDSGRYLWKMHDYDSQKTFPYIKIFLTKHIKSVTSKNSYVFGYLIRVVTYKTGKEALGLLNELLDNPHLKKVAVQLILILNQDTKGTDLAEKMFKVCIETKAYDFALDIAGIGGPKSKKLAFKLCLSKGKFFDRQAAWWIEKELTLSKAVNIAFELGIVKKKPSDKEVFKQNVFSEVFIPLNHRFYNYLSTYNYMLNFDLETGFFPVGYQELFQEKIKNLTKAYFQPQETYELYIKAEEKYLIAFKDQGEAFQFKCENMGDWYDMDSVLNAMNEHFHNKGIEKRFIMLRSLGQNCMLLFVDMKKFNELRSQLFLTPSQEYKEVIERNKEFENRVKEKLGLKESEAMSR
ncbi:MAG: hypothetical protein NE334_13500 [Lentisphaeraceae bacterium]|nr:hypothetical protein [Lentisphaeraceae bacterium]